MINRVKEEGHTLRTVNRRTANWLGQFSRRNCLLKHVIEGKIEEKDSSDGKTKKMT